MRSQRRGFTLLELIAVVTIISILAAIAVVNLRQSRGRTLLSVLHSDLRNLAVAQEGHFYQHGHYTPDLAQLPVGASAGVTLTVTSADALGWGATADHAGASLPRCAIFYGAPSSRPGPAVSEGVIACQ